jgi:hypothetical protein
MRSSTPAVGCVTRCRSTDLAIGRFAIIEKSREFALGRWSAALASKPTGIARRENLSWALGRQQSGRAVHGERSGPRLQRPDSTIPNLGSTHFVLLPPPVLGLFWKLHFAKRRAPPAASQYLCAHYAGWCSKPYIRAIAVKRAAGDLMRFLDIGPFGLGERASVS